jgi:hypothetical protein
LRRHKEANVAPLGKSIGFFAGHRSLANAVPSGNGVATIAVSWQEGELDPARTQRGAVETSGQGGDESGNGMMEVSRAP